MYTILLVTHSIIVLFLIVMVLIQRTDSDGLGGLGGGGGNQFLSGRSQANLMTKTTAILAGAFMLTSLTLAIMASRMSERSIIDAAPTAAQTQTAPATVTKEKAPESNATPKSESPTEAPKSEAPAPNSAKTGVSMATRYDAFVNQEAPGQDPLDVAPAEPSANGVVSPQLAATGGEGTFPMKGLSPLKDEMNRPLPGNIADTFNQARREKLARQFPAARSPSQNGDSPHER